MIPAVELQQLSKKFTGKKDFLAVNNINLQIASGEFFSLLGPSGCGKTTTLRTIAGFETPTSGEIFIHGEPMSHRLPFHRPVNTVFQNYALFPHLTVAQNVAFGLEMENRPRREIQNRVAEVLAQVKLTGMEKRYPRQLSGGQQQRVALARALIKQPAVLLFDEPLGALDLKLRKEMQLELKRMQQRLGITFIYVTHDQEEALTMSDRIAVMDQGRVLQVGTPVEIYENPTSRFVADFIGETNFLIGRVIKRHLDAVTILVDEQLPVCVSCDDEIPLDSIVTLVVRPEKVVIFPANSDESLQGKVEETVYIGTDTRYIVRLTEQSCIIVRSQNLHYSDLHRFNSGDTVKVKLPPDSIRILTENSSTYTSYNRQNVKPTVLATSN
ncbi:ABC transporter ATP-binding protein [Gloeocapsopsis sp. IPPAS B-1203]|uniref:ABC transporter ATP-binding protein n=1 Tax=Gloeocapsopsis sp. IPPAS B-1203 TaxID=2049454 RepID=UPI0025A0A370|nr:ABC transporter ATP-binding protein [Gloeocapsopsis sp. IPPAS B-1203]